MVSVLGNDTVYPEGDQSHRTVETGFHRTVNGGVLEAYADAGGPDDGVLLGVEGSDAVLAVL